MKEIIARAIQAAIIWYVTANFVDPLQELAPWLPGFVTEIGVAVLGLLLLELLYLQFAIPVLTLEWSAVGVPRTQAVVEASTIDLDGRGVYYELGSSIKYESLVYRSMLRRAVRAGFSVRIEVSHSPVALVVDVCNPEADGEPSFVDSASIDCIEFHPQEPVPATDTARWSWARVGLFSTAAMNQNYFDIVLTRAAQGRKARFYSRLIRIKSSADQVFVYR